MEHTSMHTYIHTQMKWRRVERKLRVEEGKEAGGLSLQQPGLNKGVRTGILGETGILRAEQH